MITLQRPFNITKFCHLQTFILCLMDPYTTKTTCVNIGIIFDTIKYAKRNANVRLLERHETQ